MLMKILPIILFLIGSSAGVGAGIFLRPEPEIEPSAAHDAIPERPTKHTSVPEEDKTSVDYVKLNNQFVVPVVSDKRVSSLIVMSLSIEVPESERDTVFKHEPKLRDSFLQVLFDHANIGGFDGAFTHTKNLEALRRALTETGQRDIGENIVKDVLITEIARQDY